MSGWQCYFVHSQLVVAVTVSPFKSPTIDSLHVDILGYIDVYTFIHFEIFKSHWRCLSNACIEGARPLVEVWHNVVKSLQIRQEQAV